jgi:hypothetical protein
VEKLTERQLEMWVDLANDLRDQEAALIGAHVARIIGNVNPLTRIPRRS